MRIALDATYSLGDSLSGVGVYSREILEGLARIHPEAHFDFCYRPHRLLRSLREALPPNARRRLLGLPAFPRLFHGLNQRLPAWPRFKRSVTTFHDLFVLTGDYSTPEFRRRFAAQARAAAARSDHIIAVSAFTAGQVEQLLGVDRRRITVIHHGVRPPALTAPAARENVVLHVGAIQRRKNIVRLVEAFEQCGCEDWKLVLAGSAGFGSDEILGRVESSPCRTSILVTGYVEAEELARWYARARVLAFASLDEGFGIPVLEGMAAGVPVLTSNRSALPEVAGGAALLVDPEDGGAIAGGLRRLMTDRELRESLIAAGLRRAAGCGWDVALAKTWAVYEALG